MADGSCVCCGHFPIALRSFIIHSAHFSEMHIRLEVYYLLLQQRHGLNWDAPTHTQGNVTAIKLRKKDSSECRPRYHSKSSMIPKYKLDSFI